MALFTMWAKGPGEPAIHKIVTVDQTGTTPIDTVLGLLAHQFVRDNGPGSIVELRNNVGAVLVRLTTEP